MEKTMKNNAQNNGKQWGTQPEVAPFCGDKKARRKQRRAARAQIPD